MLITSVNGRSTMVGCSSSLTAGDIGIDFDGYRARFYLVLSLSTLSHSRRRHSRG
jgi:hypothetical protein